MNASAKNGWKLYMLFRFEILMQFFVVVRSYALCACLFMVAIKCCMRIVLFDESEMRNAKKRKKTKRGKPNKKWA